MSFDPGLTTGPFNLVWIDREGREEPIAGEPAAYQEFSLSPDGTQVAIQIEDADDAVWVIDLSRGIHTRLTFASDEVGTFFPTWTPDGLRVAFGSPMSWKRADGIGAIERLDETPRLPQAFSPDGRTLVFHEGPVPARGQLGVLTLGGCSCWSAPGGTPLTMRMVTTPRNRR